ncbi:MAG TPA: glycine betaine ABC transporter substrate-binding protein, partial [Solirubrobacteraceae bacterium]|nr:glycine betaine ABC transporter substrate-binding protein [Solirubrobacteraceae bacterium]
MTIPRIPRLAALLGMLLAAAAFLAACGSDNGSDTASTGSGQTTASGAAIQRSADNSKTTIVVGSKNFTEQKVLGEIYAQAFEAAGYKVKKELNLGDEQTALKALKGGQISGYPEYTGTALLSFLKVPAGKLPSSEQEAYQQVKDGMAKQGIVAEPPTPFTSSNEVGVTKDTAEKLGLSKISDLQGKSKDLTLYGSPECRTRRDCLL